MTPIIVTGPPGLSAYQLAVLNGYGGTLADYLASAGGNLQPQVDAAVAAATAATAVVPALAATLNNDLSGSTQATFGITTPDTATISDGFGVAAMDVLARGGVLQSVTLRMSAAGTGLIEIVSPAGAILYAIPVAPGAGLATLTGLGNPIVPPGGAIFYRKLTGGNVRYMTTGGGMTWSYAAADAADGAVTLAPNNLQVAIQIVLQQLPLPGAASQSVVYGSVAPSVTTSPTNFGGYAPPVITRRAGYLSQIRIGMSAAGTGYIEVVQKSTGAILKRYYVAPPGAGVFAFTPDVGLIPAGCYVAYRWISGGNVMIAASANSFYRYTDADAADRSVFTDVSLSYDIAVEWTVAEAIKGSMSAGVRALLPGAGAEGTRILGVFDGFAATFDNSAPNTFETMIETAQQFDAIRVVLLNNGAAPFTVAKAVASARADTAPADNNAAATWVAVTFGGAAAGVVPASPGPKRPGWLVSDWIPLSSIARGDGGKGGVAMVRAYVSTAGALTIMKASTIDALAARTDGGAWLNRASAGDCATTIASFAGTTNVAQTPIAGLSYAARGTVVNLLGVGDSTTEGYADTMWGDGVGGRLAHAMTDPNGVAFEWANLGWSGSTTATFLQRLQDFIAAGLHADIALYAAGSPNDTGFNSETLTDAQVAVMRQNRQLAFRAMRAAGILPFPTTWGPFGTDSAKAYPVDYNGSDAKRVADNAATLALASRGIPVADFAGCLYASTDGDGQQLPLVKPLADNTHPSSNGYIQLRQVAEAVLRQLLGVS